MKSSFQMNLPLVDLPKLSSRQLLLRPKLFRSIEIKAYEQIDLSSDNICNYLKISYIKIRILYVISKW
jgi:hypothetical protein